MFKSQSQQACYVTVRALIKKTGDPAIWVRVMWIIELHTLELSDSSEPSGTT